MFKEALAGMGRAELEQYCDDLHRILAYELERSGRLEENLTRTQERCTKLIQELRALKR